VFLSSIVSKDGVGLYNNTVWAYPVVVPKPPLMLSSTGSALNSAVTAVLIVALIIKLVGGACSPVMWGMLNQMQIIYFFPLLMLYFPQNLSSFL
jgi:hypothetical protein